MLKDKNVDFGIYLVANPAEEVTIPKGAKIPAGVSLAMLVKDNVNKVNVYEVANVNPPWVRVQKAIEANGAVNASNTDEIIATYFIGNVTSITAIA